MYVKTLDFLIPLKNLPPHQYARIGVEAYKFTSLLPNYCLFEQKSEPSAEIRN